MDRDYVTRLVLAVYKETKEWEDEYLRLKMRNLATETLSTFLIALRSNPGNGSKELKETVSEFRKMLEVARRKKMLGRDQFIFLRDEFEKLGFKFEEPKKKKEPKKKEKSAESADIPKPKGALNRRQEKILRILEDEGKAQVSDLKEFFPDISKRTLRRDLDGLLESSLIERRGEWNEVFYTLARS